MPKLAVMRGKEVGGYAGETAVHRAILFLSAAAFLLIANNSGASNFAPTHEERAAAIQQGAQRGDLDVAAIPRKIDRQGRTYVQIDDMRFVVPETIEPAAGFTGNPWPNGRVYYQFASNISSVNRTAWRNAAAVWSAVAALQFIEGTGSGNYIYVQSSSMGNYSYIGMTGGPQDMHIQSWDYTYIIAHEIGHALGLIHEHQRTDRGAYVQINAANVQSQHYSDNFPTMASTTYGAYDFDSIMHYNQCAFSIDCPNGASCSCTHRTITCLPPYTQWQYQMGQINHLSQPDRSGMAQRYGPPGAGSSSRCDFNGDGYPDIVAFWPFSTGGGETTVFFLQDYINNTVASGPMIPAGWELVDVADINRDGKLDYVLFKPATRQTAIWYLWWERWGFDHFVGSAYGPTLPAGWELVALADFNRDGKPDYLLYTASTRQTAIWYLNNNVFVSGAYGPSLPAGSQVAGIADFNHDNKPDYLLYNASTRQTAIWYMNNNALSGNAPGPTIVAGYTLIGAADFNRDGNPDYLLYNPASHQTAIWYLNDNVFLGGMYGPPIFPDQPILP
jgi:astacin (peptidase family M12A)/VCBS repeat protein